GQDLGDGGGEVGQGVRVVGSGVHRHVHGAAVVVEVYPAGDVGGPVEPVPGAGDLLVEGVPQQLARGVGCGVQGGEVGGAAGAGAAGRAGLACFGVARGAVVRLGVVTLDRIGL